MFLIQCRDELHRGNVNERSNDEMIPNDCCQ